jgi:Skp family chaperone for outer membrane proteins
MDLRVIDLHYRLEQAQKRLKGDVHLRSIYADDIKEIEKILSEIEALEEYQINRAYIV